MNDTLRETILARGARHFAADRRVVAAALTAYGAHTGLDEAALAAWLGLSVERLHGLALCTAPNLTSPHAADEVAVLARYVGCDADRLRNLLDAATPPPNHTHGGRPDAS